MGVMRTQDQAVDRYLRMGKGTVPQKCRREPGPAAGGLSLTGPLTGLQELRGWGHKHIT